MRSYVCEGCGGSFAQAGKGRPRKRCDACRAGSGGTAPRKRDVDAQAQTDAVVMAFRGAPSEEPPPPGSLDHRGPVERAMVGDLDALISAHPMGEVLAETARLVARRVDLASDRELAGLVAQLRGVVDDLVSFTAGGGSDDEPADIDFGLTAT